MSSKKRQRLSLTKKVVHRTISVDNTVSHNGGHTIAKLFKLQQSSPDKAILQDDSNYSCLNMSTDLGAKLDQSSLKYASDGSTHNSVQLSSTELSEKLVTDNSCSSAECLTDSDVPCNTENSVSDVHVLTTNLYLSAEDKLIDNPIEGNSLSVNTVRDELKADKSSENFPYIPYYLESFLLVIDTVLNDSFYCDLFSDDDLVPVGLFRSLSGK